MAFVQVMLIHTESQSLFSQSLCAYATAAL